MIPISILIGATFGYVICVLHERGRTREATLVLITFTLLLIAWLLLGENFVIR